MIVNQYLCGPPMYAMILALLSYVRGRLRNHATT